MKITEHDRDKLNGKLEDIAIHVNKRSVELNDGEVYIQAMIEEVDLFRDMLIRIQENGGR